MRGRKWNNTQEAFTIVNAANDITGVVMRRFVRINNQISFLYGDFVSI